jgi:integration host factor subunit beta
MTKSELVRGVGELSPDLQQRDVERVVDTIFKQIGIALARGARVEIRGLGALSVKHRDARTGRNPGTGATSMSRPRSLPSSKPASSCTRV